MALRLDRIAFKNFRNYPDFVLSCDKNICIIVGANAVGKTNIIEGIQLMTGMDTFRSVKWDELCTWGTDTARVDAFISGDDRIIEMNMMLQQGKRSYLLNGKKKRIAELRGLLPVVLFTPDDLRMIKDDSSKRREALDFIGIQLSKTYSSLKNDFEKIVRQRNKLLKDQIINVGLVDSWTASLVLIGSRFYQHRHNLFERLREKVMAIHAELVPHEQLDIRYVPSWERDSEAVNEISQELADLKDIRNVFSVAIDERRGKELERRMTLIGPHRDEIIFYIDGRDARKYASQGQQRSIVLSWKLAEVALIKEIGGQPPVLLLDDVMSELDES